jgi:hypothetical protein
VSPHLLSTAGPKAPLSAKGAATRSEPTETTSISAQSETRMNLRQTPSNLKKDHSHIREINFSKMFLTFVERFYN